MKSADFSLLAESDLNDIVDFIARDSPSAAQTLIMRIREKCETLASFPELGRVRSGFRDPEIRSLGFGNYVIFYRPKNDGVEIARVLHGARDLESLL